MCRLSKSMDNPGSIENNGGREEQVLNDIDKKIPLRSERFRYGNDDTFFGVRDTMNLISNDTFLIRDTSGDHYSIYFDTKDSNFEIDNDQHRNIKWTSF